MLRNVISKRRFRPPQDVYHGQWVSVRKPRRGRVKKVFVIGGMGAGKSTACQALADQGLPCIDLDKIGHEIHRWDVVKDDLVASFGPEVLDESGNVNRAVLAAKAFDTAAHTRLLNRITMPRIEDAFDARLAELEAEGNPAAVVEYSAFTNRATSIARSADVIVAILAPVDLRVQRAVAAGWDEADVCRRIARQITDDERRALADVSFENVGSPDALYDQVVAWWKGYTAKHGIR